MKNKQLIIYCIAIAIVIYLGLSFIFNSFYPSDMNIATKGFNVVLWIFISIFIIIENKND